MDTGDINAAFCSEFVAGLADAGVTTAFVSPGSRNTPLVLALVAESRIEDINVRDERAAGFMALGHAKATGVPAAVACTSGSAAAHYFPSVVEADQSSTPMIVLTADRPIRLRGTGAPQTMDQTELFGSHVKRFIDTANSTLDGRSLGVDMVLRSLDVPGGAVHVNLPFDEPLLPTQIPDAADPRPVDVPVHQPPAVTGLLEHLTGKRTLIVTSGRQHPRFGAVASDVAERMGAVVVPDPQTPMSGATVMRYGDLLIGSHDRDGRSWVRTHLEPEAILRLGPLPTSKPLWTWFDSFEGIHVHVDVGRLLDPFSDSATHVASDPLAFLLNEPLGDGPVDTAWAEKWAAADAAAAGAMESALAGLAWPNEPSIARTVAESVPDGTVLYLASSRPIRDVDAFAAARSGPTVLSNRGVNGIDGTIASATGAALSGTPTTLLIGDVAALHDATSLGEAARLGAPLRVVVVNNDGGGIFEFLPQATSEVLDRAAFERHWGTPHGLSLSSIAGALGLAVTNIGSSDELGEVVSAPPDTPSLIEIATRRDRIVDDHRTVREAVAAALFGL